MYLERCPDQFQFLDDIAGGLDLNGDACQRDPKAGDIPKQQHNSVITTQ